jgi:TolB-like protein/Tfp pilus assembly protein PilF
VIELRVLGSPDVRQLSPSAVSLHLPAKPMALLACLAVDGSGRFTRRDHLLPLFWPELNEEGARNALSQALHRIRRVLGPGTIIGRGREEVRASPERIACDVAAFDRAIADERFAEAVDLYRGPLLDGLHVPGAPAFEHWLDSERERLATLAREATAVLAKREEGAGNPAGAARWLRRLLDIAPENEVALRRLMHQLDQLGDRPGAMRAYRSFVHRLTDDFGLDPAPETHALAARIADPAAAAHAAGEPRLPSVAVLPFTNPGDDPEQEAFCHGMTEELMMVLARIPGLRVSARASVFALHDAAPDPGALGRQLRVDAIVRGSVRRAGDRLRVNVSLIRAADDSQLRSERYDRPAGDVFAVQDDIARSIAAALRVDLLNWERSRAGPVPTTDVEAHSLYLRGLFHRRKRTTADLKKACELFEQATERDPSFARAHAALAFTRALSGWFLFGVCAPGDAYPRAAAAAAAALSLDDGIAEAHTALGCIRFMYDWDGVGAERAFRQALALDPENADALGNYSGLLAACGRFDEAIALNRSGMRHDPLWIMPVAAEGVWLFAARRYDEAVVQLQRAHDMEPDFFLPLLFLGDTCRFMQRIDAARAAYEAMLERVGPRSLGLARVAALDAVAGRHADALARLAELRERAEDGFVGPALLADIHLALGERERALSELARAVDERDTTLALIRIWPGYDELRGDVAFDRVMRQVRL